MDFYVISVHHTHRPDKYITLWAPDNKGYVLRTNTAGKYSDECVRASLGYYNSGCSNIAVPCTVLDALTATADPRDFCGATPVAQPFLVVLNTRANWKALIAHVIEPPAHAVRPEFPGARRRKE